MPFEAPRGEGARHQLGAVNAVGERMTERVQGPHERLAVRDVERTAASEGGAQLGVFVGGHHGMRLRAHT